MTRPNPSLPPPPGPAPAPAAAPAPPRRRRRAAGAARCRRAAAPPTVGRPAARRPPHRRSSSPSPFKPGEDALPLAAHARQAAGVALGVAAPVRGVGQHAAAAAAELALHPRDLVLQFADALRRGRQRPSRRRAPSRRRRRPAPWRPRRPPSPCRRSRWRGRLVPSSARPWRSSRRRRTCAVPGRPRRFADLGFAGDLLVQRRRHGPAAASSASLASVADAGLLQLLLVALHDLVGQPGQRVLAELAVELRLDPRLHAGRLVGRVVAWPARAALMNCASASAASRSSRPARATGPRGTDRPPCGRRPRPW